MNSTGTGVPIPTFGPTSAWCEDGCLVIEARKDDAGYPYTSASVISRGDTLALPPWAVWT